MITSFTPTATLNLPRHLQVLWGTQRPFVCTIRCSDSQQISPRPVLVRCASPLTLSFNPSSILAATILGAFLALSPLDSLSWAYGLKEGRLDSCKGDMSCVSTSSVANPSKFGAPWTFEPQTNEPVEAWAALKSVIAKNTEGGVIVEEIDGPKLFYLRAEFPASFGLLNAGNIDDVEFRMIPEERLVTYRSASRQALYLYPVQRPIDTGKNRARLEQIRGELGWVALDGEGLY